MTESVETPLANSIPDEDIAKRAARGARMARRRRLVASGGGAEEISDSPSSSDSQVLVRSGWMRTAQQWNSCNYLPSVVQARPEAETREKVSPWLLAYMRHCNGVQPYRFFLPLGVLMEHIPMPGIWVRFIGVAEMLGATLLARLLRIQQT
jgi:hypothetical protein